MEQTTFALGCFPILLNLVGRDQLRGFGCGFKQNWFSPNPPALWKSVEAVNSYCIRESIHRLYDRFLPVDGWEGMYCRAWWRFGSQWQNAKCRSAKCFSMNSPSPLRFINLVDWNFCVLLFTLFGECCFVFLVPTLSSTVLFCTNCLHFDTRNKKQLNNRRIATYCFKNN